MTRTLWAIAATVILIAYMVIFRLWWAYEPPTRVDWSSQFEKRWVVEQMRFHGIGGCIRDENGYWFERAGKRCRL